MTMNEHNAIQELKADNRKLRELLALQFSDKKLYTEDGKLIDDSEYPYIDFGKDTVWEIEQKIFKRISLKTRRENPQRLNELAKVFGVELQ